MKKLLLITTLFTFAKNAHAQYIDSVEHLLDRKYIKTTKSDEGVSFYRKAYKKQDNTWEVATYYYFNMQLKEAGTYLDNDFKIKDGKFYYYYQNGQLKQECSYYRNNRVGLFKRYSPKGSLMDSSRYKSTGIPFHKSFRWDANGNKVFYGKYDMKGEGTGYETEYFSNGEVRSYGKYAKGYVKDSTWTYYRHTGGVSFKEFFEFGTLVNWMCFDTLGNKQEEVCDTSKSSAKSSYDFHKRLSDHANPPMLKSEKTSSYNITIRFDIDIDGTIENILVEGAFDEFHEEIVRVIKKFPKWIPAIEKKRKIPSEFVTYMTFVRYR